MPEQPVAEPPSGAMAFRDVRPVAGHLPVCGLWPKCTVRLPLPGAGQGPISISIISPT